MKKISILILFALMTTGVFAQFQISAGGGIFMDMSFFNGYTIGDINVGYRNLGCSAFIFLDAVYAELGIGFGYGMMSKVVKRSPVPIEGKPDFGDLWQLDLSVMGKYPFELGPVTLFPLFGASYKCVLFGKEPGTASLPHKNKEFNQFGLLAGIGLDHDLIESLYLRAELLFHLRFPMEFVRQNLPPGASATNGAGGRFKVGIGYRF